MIPTFSRHDGLNVLAQGVKVYPVSRTYWALRVAFSEFAVETNRGWRVGGQGDWVVFDARDEHMFIVPAEEFDRNWRELENVEMGRA